MTAFCGSGEDGDVSTPSATPDRPTAAPVTLQPGPTYLGKEPDDTLTTIATGDFNGDGEVDLALGAAFAAHDGADNSGAVYVFLSVGESGEFSVSEADAIFVGGPGDQAGRSLAVADLNGDRVDDLIIGAPGASEAERANVGRVYVLAGNPVFLSVRARDLTMAPSITGEGEGDFFGYSLATGDLNGDGVHDLAIGALLADGTDDAREDSGEVHVLFGGNRPATLDLADTTLDVTIVGAAAGDRLGEALAAGDFNGDGRDDLVVAATFADGEDAEDVGITYALTGSLREEIDLDDSVPGVRIIGIDEGDQLGHSVAMLDFNGDGIDDILLGAVSADGPDNQMDLAGEVALILGSPEHPRDLHAREAAQVIHGPAGGRLGRAVAGGDLDGDGFDDALLIASEAADDRGTSETGALFVVFGGESVRLPESTAEALLAVYGRAEGDNLGTQVNGIPAVASADLNKDRLWDILVAAPRADAKRGEVMTYFSEVRQ